MAATATKEAPAAPVAPEAAKPKITFVAAPLTALPTRKPPVRAEVDLDTAKAIFDLISATVEINGEQVQQTASDGVLYPDTKSARAEANKAARLVAHVLPEGKITKSRVYETDKGSGKFAWAIWLADAPVEEATTETPAVTATETPATPAAA